MTAWLAILAPLLLAVPSGGSAASKGREVAPAKPNAPTIAVMPFYDGAVKAYWAPYWGRGRGWTVGRGVTDMLIAALAELAKKRGSFRVVEREQLEKVLAEQKLTATGMIEPKTAAKIGRLLGAQIILTGSVTDLTVETDYISLPWKAGFGGWRTRAVVGLSGRLVDTETAEVLSGLSSKATKSQFGVRITRGKLAGLEFGSREFEATILGRALKEAVRDLALKVAKDIEAGVYARRLLPQRAGLVAYVKGEVAVINLGTRHGVRPGDEFVVLRVLETIKDPETGEVLTELRQEVGRLKVERVEPKASWCKVEADEGIKVGDRVRLIVGSAGG